MEPNVVYTRVAADGLRWRADLLSHGSNTYLAHAYGSTKAKARQTLFAMLAQRAIG